MKTEYVYVAYDCVLKRPGCALLQAAKGCDPHLAHRFNTETWLLAPTPNLKRYGLTHEQLDRLVGITNGKEPA